MQHSKLISILKSLDPTEFRQFYRYLQAPLLTQSKDVLKLYDIVRKHYPAFDSPKLERQKVFKKLYPKKAFDTNRFSILLFKLTKILDEYLIFLKYQQDEFQKKKLLTQIYGERNLNVIFKKNTEELLTELEKQPYRDARYFYDKYFLQQDYYFHNNTPKKGTIVETLKNVMNNLNHFFSVERLNIGIELKSREQIYAECNEFDITPKINLKNNLAYKLLKAVYRLIQYKEEAIYWETKQLFLKNQFLFSVKSNQIILTTLLNFSIHQLAFKEEEYLAEVFELYKIGLKKNLLFYEGQLKSKTFLNIVMSGSKLKEFDFISQFIQDSHQFLDKKNKTDVLRLAKGYFHFFQANFDKVIDYLQSFEFFNLTDKVNAKLLLIRSYYHISQSNSSFIPLVTSNCDAFEKFIKRNDNLNFQRKEAIYNFIFLLKKIIKYETSNRKISQSKSELQDIADNLNYIVNRGWIIGIIQNL